MEKLSKKTRVPISAMEFPAANHFFSALIVFILFAFGPCLHAAPVPLFDAKTFDGWEGNTGKVWRIEDGALAAGSLEKNQEKNDFLATVKQFENFELTLKWKLEGTKGFVNGGVQFRTKRIPNNHEVSGYQADLGAGYDGALYDESRRNKVLAQPSKEFLEKARKPLGEWNDYRIRADGNRIQIWLNDVQTVDFTETDASIPRTGIIAVQIHGGATSVVRYKDIMIEELPVSPKPVVPKAEVPPTGKGASLFDGKTFAGWQGDTAKTWRVRDGAFVGGSLEGRHLRTWVNGVLMADHTERDQSLKRGVFALELSARGSGVARFKDFKVEVLPPSPVELEPATGPVSRMTDTLKPRPRLEPFAAGKFALDTGDVVVFTGSENMVMEQGTGGLESVLALRWKDAAPRFRHMGWEGDTVFRQNRMMEWGSWRSNLDGAGATVVVAWFGQVEALDTKRTVEEFAAAYRSLLNEFAKSTPRIVVIGPPPFERPADARTLDNSALNERVATFNEAIRALATQPGFVFVDLFAALKDSKGLTRDGMHFTEEGSKVVGRVIGRALGAEVPFTEPLRAAVVEKNRLWFDTWRCMNWAFAFGDRTDQPFARGAADRPPFADELRKYQPLLSHADNVVHALAAGKAASPPLAPLPPRADPPAISPEDEMAKFKLRDGFTVNHFADERLGVIRPVQIRWDERGRLWVACTPTYPQLQPGEHGTDFIVILEDTDGDGHADKSTRFAEQLTMPLGFEFAPQDVGGGIYVVESTKLIHLPDPNHDDHADGRSVVLSGFGTGDSHQNANSLRWGPDGCLWFTQGYHSWSYVETPRGVAELNRSGIWRFNPRTRRLDSFLNENGAGLNNWGTAWDDFGQVFHTSGADLANWFTTPALVPTLHPLSLPTEMSKSRSKGMELEFLGSSHLPADLRGVMLKSTFYTGQVQLYRLRDAGSGFTSEEPSDLMSGGNEFRPVETRGGPDGAIYVCDWLNPVIGHYQASYRDPRRDRSHGRIWRISAKNSPLVPKPALAAKNAAQLLVHLESSERWERDAAKFALYRKPSAEVLAAASKVDVAKASPRLLYELSGVLAAHESARPEIIDRLLASDDFRWRAWGARLIGVGTDYLKDPLPALRKAIADQHPRVRLEAVVACSWMPPQLAPEAVKLATVALEKPMDAPLNYALTQCIHALAPYWKPALAKGSLDFGDRFHALAKVLTTVGDKTIVARVRDLLSSNKLAPAARENLLSVLIQYGTDRDADFAIAQAPDSQVVLDALVAAAWRKPNADYGGGLKQLFASPHSAAHIAACRIVARTGKDWGTADKIEKLLANETATPSERTAAMAAIAKLRGKAALPTLVAFAESSDATLRSGALAAVAPLDPVSVAKLSAQLLPKTQSTADIAPLFAPLLGQKDGAALLAKAIGDVKLFSDTANLALRWMAENGRDDAPLRNALNTAAGIVSSTALYSEALVKRLATEAATRGDAKRGAALFANEQSNCLSCHKVGDTGGALGPDLSAISRAMTQEAIVESVFWPKRQVKEGYMLTQVTTKDGQIQAGYIGGETAELLTLKDLSGNPGAPIAKRDVSTRSDAGTLMPDGLADWMSEQQRLDLLRYLFELGNDAKGLTK